MTPNISAKNHINELCEVFLDETGKKEREKSIKNHFGRIIQFLHADAKYYGSTAPSNASDPAATSAPADVEQPGAGDGAIPTDGITDDAPTLPRLSRAMPEEEPGMICVGCRQQTHSALDLCINCSRLEFFDGLTESVSTTSNSSDPAATSAPADVEQPGPGVGAILGEELNINVDQVNNENIRPALVKSFNLLGRQQSIQEQSENILNGHALTRERPCLRDELDSTVPHIINGQSFQILSHLYGRASTRNLPRPSPYSLKDRPRRPSNCRDLGR